MLLDARRHGKDVRIEHDVFRRKAGPLGEQLERALGRGGKGLYGLDVTTPSSFAAGNVLWELRDDGAWVLHEVCRQSARWAADAL